MVLAVVVVVVVVVVIVVVVVVAVVMAVVVVVVVVVVVAVVQFLWFTVAPCCALEGGLGQGAYLDVGQPSRFLSRTCCRPAV